MKKTELSAQAAVTSRQKYQAPALETTDMELGNILEGTTTLPVSDETTTTVDSRDLLIFTLMDE